MSISGHNEVGEMHSQYTANTRFENVSYFEF
jgi:hypothetical protein